MPPKAARAAVAAKARNAPSTLTVAATSDTGTAAGKRKRAEKVSEPSAEEKVTVEPPAKRTARGTTRVVPSAGGPTARMADLAKPRGRGEPTTSFLRAQSLSSQSEAPEAGASTSDAVGPEPPIALVKKPSMASMASAGAGRGALYRSTSATTRTGAAPASSAPAADSTGTGSVVRRMSLSSTGSQSVGPSLGAATYKHVASSGYGRASVSSRPVSVGMRRASVGAASSAVAVAVEQAEAALQGRLSLAPSGGGRQDLSRSALGSSRVGGQGPRPAHLGVSGPAHLGVFDKNVLAVLMSTIAEANALAEGGRRQDALAVFEQLGMELPAARCKAVFWASQAAVVQASGERDALHATLSLYLAGIDACAGYAMEVVALNAGVRMVTQLLAAPPAGVHTSPSAASMPGSSKRKVRPSYEGRGSGAALLQDEKGGLPEAGQRADDALILAVLGGVLAPIPAPNPGPPPSASSSASSAMVITSPSFATAEAAGLPSAFPNTSAGKGTGTGWGKAQPVSPPPQQPCHPTSESFAATVTPAVRARLAAITPALALALGLVNGGTTLAEDGNTAFHGAASSGAGSGQRPSKPAGRVSFGRATALSFSTTAVVSDVGADAAAAAHVPHAPIPRDGHSPSSSTPVPGGVRDALRTLDTIRAKQADASRRRLGRGADERGTPRALSRAAGEEEDSLVSPERVVLKSTRKAPTRLSFDQESAEVGGGEGGEYDYSSNAEGAGDGGTPPLSQAGQGVRVLPAAATTSKKGRATRARVAAGVGSASAVKPRAAGGHLASALPLQMGSAMIPSGLASLIGLPEGAAREAKRIRTQAKGMVGGMVAEGSSTPPPQAASSTPTPTECSLPMFASGSSSIQRTPASARVRRSVRAHRSAVKAAVLSAVEGEEYDGAPVGSPIVPAAGPGEMRAHVPTLDEVGALSHACAAARNPLLRSALRSVRDLAAARLYCHQSRAGAGASSSSDALPVYHVPTPSSARKCTTNKRPNKGGTRRCTAGSREDEEDEGESGINRRMSGSALLLRRLSAQLGLTASEEGEGAGVDVSVLALADVDALAQLVDEDEEEEEEATGRSSSKRMRTSRGRLSASSAASSRSLVLDDLSGLPLVQPIGMGMVSLPALGRGDMALLDALGQALTSSSISSTSGMHGEAPLPLSRPAASVLADVATFMAAEVAALPQEG